MLFRAAVRLGGAPAPAEPDALVRAAATLAGFEPSAFDWALEMRARPRTPALKPFDPIAAGYLAAIEQFVHYVNELE